MHRSENSSGHWSAVWANSGVAGLSGRSDGPPLPVPQALVHATVAAAERIATASARLGSTVVVDGPALLGERAALAGLSRNGDISCGGATRLLATADGWIAVSLARRADLDAVPAWLECGELPAATDDVWSCVEVPDSVELLGTGKAVRVVATVDGHDLTAGLMPTGSGGHMLSISAKLRRKLGKEVGDTVSVHLSQRLT